MGIKCRTLTVRANPWIVLLLLLQRKGFIVWANIWARRVTQQAALTVAHTLFGAPYLSEDEEHQGSYSAFYLSQSQWVGLCAHWAHSSLRRVFDVGRLSRDGIGGFDPKREIDDAPYLTFFDQ